MKKLEGARSTVTKPATLLKEYRMHRRNAARRGIPFKLSFEEWLDIWLSSGHLDQRGRGTDRYHMVRFDGKGAYEVGNVHIITHQQNNKDHLSHARALRKPHKHTAASKLKISQSNKGRIGGFTGKHHSEATKQWKRQHWGNQYGASAKEAN